MFVLAIDTSNKTLSVAICKNEELLVQLTEETKNNHSSRLMPVIEAAFSQANMRPEHIDLIAVAQGPGSYTGVRIGATVAKTLAWTLNKPLVGVSSLEVLARNLTVKGTIVPLIDARRQTVFAGAYSDRFEAVVADGHYELEKLLEALPEGPLHFLGDIEPYQELIANKLGSRAHYYPEKNKPQGAMAAAAALVREPILDIHKFAPLYHRLPEAEVIWQNAQEGKNE